MRRLTPALLFVLSTLDLSLTAQSGQTRVAPPPQQGSGGTQALPSRDPRVGSGYQGPVGGGDPPHNPGGGGPGNTGGEDPDPIGGGPGNNPPQDPNQEGDPPLPPPTHRPPAGTGGGLTNGGAPGTGPSPHFPSGAPGLGHVDPKGRTIGPFRNGYADARWENWWLLNHATYVDVKHHYQLRSARIEQSSDVFLGGAEPAHARPVQVTDDALRRRVAPPLVMLLDHDNPDVRAEAALALGKVSGGDAVAFLSRLVHDANAHVRHIAVLAMGLTGDASAFPELARFLLDTQRYAYDRAFAAIGLGLLGAPEAGPVLAKVLAEKDRTRDIHGAALYALAFLGDEASLEILSEYAEDPAKDEFLRGAAHVALGKTGDLSRRRILLSGLRDKSVNVRRSAATALANLDFTSPFLARRDALARTRRDMKSAGILTANAEKALDQQLAEIDKATQEDERRLGALRTQILFELVDVIANDSDVMVRNFASIALGRIGGPHASRELVRHYKKTSDASGKSFAVLSLGLANAVDALPLLRKELESSNVDVSAKGAIVIAIGLLKDEKSLGRIADLALGRGDPSLRGYAAIAAGMIGDASVIRDFRKVLTSRTNPELMPDFGLALGMLGDRDAVDPLGTLLNGPDTATIHIQASRALGSIADSSAIQHLLDALASKKLETQAVAAAARALGVVAEKGDLPLLTPMARDYNYLLDIESMNEILVQ